MINFVRSDKFYVGMFITALVVGLISHLATVGFSPLPWFDEVAILEMVRGGVVHPPHEYGMHLEASDALNSQSWALFYLGGWIQNALYNLFGFYGPRIADILVLLALSLMGSYYTWRKTRSVKIASLLGVILCSFPLFVRSARANRVDMWTILLFFIVLSILETGKNASQRSKTRIAFVSGILIVLSVFIWITSIFFAPIYLWALIGYDEKHWIRNVLICALGAFVTLALLMIPFYPTFSFSMETFASTLLSVSGASRTEFKLAMAWRSFIYFIAGFPFVALVGTTLLFSSRRVRLVQLGAIAFFVICVLVCKSMYVYRFVYFMPFAILGIVVWASDHPTVRKVLIIILLPLAVFCYARGIVLRNGIEFLAKEGRNPEPVEEVLSRKIGRGVRIYNGSHQLYYIGRNLGWRQCCGAGGRSVDFDKYGLSWFIQEQSQMNPQIEEKLASAGFKKAFDVAVPVPEDWRTRILRAAHKTLGYGPYVVYSREERAIHK